MADQKRWFKFWHSALSDDALMELPPALRWAWVALGAHTKIHGNRGTVVISLSNATLAAGMGVDLSALQQTVLRLPHISVEEGKPDNGKLTVTWRNWFQYQEDSTVLERVRRLRSKRRGEEKRKEERRSDQPSPPTPAPKNGAASEREIIPEPPGFSEFWKAWPRKVQKGAAKRAWRQMKLGPAHLPAILAGIEKRRTSKQWQEQGGRFIPHPATWLRAEGWLDEPTRWSDADGS